MAQSQLRRDYKKIARLFQPYPTVLVMADGEHLCNRCARQEAKIILREIHLVEAGERWPDNQWLPLGWEEYLEGPTIFCAHCNVEIESAYGDPDDDGARRLHMFDAAQPK